MGIDPPPLPSPSPGDHELGVASSIRLEAVVVPAPDNRRNLQAYHITDDDHLGDGGPKRKFADNLGAIRALRQIDAERRGATPEEKRIMVRYVGWGSMPQVFDEWNNDWTKEREQLRDLLSEPEIESSRATTLNAHYTSPTIVRGMYSLLERIGFTGGRILEPACGIGHFIGLMPKPILECSMVTGIEIDPLTARIAQLLYPDADIRPQGFESARLADGFYDLAISNVPFGDYPVHDPRFNAYRLPIHDYFFAAALEKIRPGGLILFITSRGTLDKRDSTLREFLHAKADLLGALRLPNDAFKHNAGTEVTTDVIALRRLAPGERPTGPTWKALCESPLEDGSRPLAINEFFVRNPHLMLGRLALTGRMYRDQEPTLEPDGRELSVAFATALVHFPEGIYRPTETIGRTAPTTLVTEVPAPDHIKPNAFCIHGGELCLRDGLQLVKLSGLPSQTRRRIRGMIAVRDAVRECLQTQLSDKPEPEILAAREHLNRAYDGFVSQFGALNDRANTRAFMGDPDLPLLLSLEDYNEETGSAAKWA